MLRKLSVYGPSLAVLATVAAVLLAGPFAVRQLTFARTQAAIIQASDRLLDSNILEQIDQAHRDIATKVEPSVVYVSTERIDTVSRSFLAPQTTQLSSGSGWVFDDLGHIVTNAHVIEDAQRIEVQLHDGVMREAEVVGTDLRTDIAVLRIKPGLLHPADRADSATVRQGDRVFAFGSPFDFRFSMSQGIVSGVGRDAQLETVRYQNFIQVDAAINPGNSGGPLTNIYGQVIGMNTAIATGRREPQNAGTFSGIGLAIPMSMIESVVDQLIDKGEVSRGYIGIEMYPELSDGRARSLGYLGDGVEVRIVESGGPAERAGLLPGDVVTAVNGTRVGTLKQIQSLISSRYPGETLTVSVWRFDREADAAETITLPVTLAEMNPEQMISRQLLSFLHGLGLARISTSTPERAQALEVTFRRGVIVEQTLPGRDVNGVIDPGTIITHVFDEQVNNIDEFYARMERYLYASPRGILVRIVTPTGAEETVNLRRQ